MTDNESIEAVASAAMDGQASAEEWTRLQPHWSQDAHLRQQWHSYHLIGDCLRSEELARSPAHDEAFLQRLRLALQNEPVVLAPSALPPTASESQNKRSGIVRGLLARRRLWASSAAALAGAFLVGGAYVTTRVDGDHSPFGVLVAAVSPSHSSVQRASIQSGVQTPEPWSQTALAQPVAGFKEVLRLPRGPAQQPHESIQVLFSDGNTTISVLIEPDRGTGRPEVPQSARLNSLSVQRSGAWLTLTGDVPPAMLAQFAAAIQLQP